MARGKKDSPAAGGSGDLMEDEEAAAAAVVEEEEGEEAEEKGAEEEEEWKEEEEEEEEEEEWVQEEDEQDEEEADEAPGEEAEQGVAGEQGSPPKLAEGFYEIETIRRRRRHKGRLQYLVKWRGWPESANTWEPVENLRACSDFVEDFEKRYGKRKRKITAVPVRSPNTSHGKRGRPRLSDPRSLSRRAVPERKMLPLRTSSRRATNNSNKNSSPGFDASVDAVAQQTLDQNVTKDGSSNVLSDGFPCQRAPISVVVQQQEEHQVVNVVSTVENSVQAPPRGVQVTGAKKRKLGSVRRFKQDEAQQDQGELHTGRHEKHGAEDVDSTEGEAGGRTKGEDCANRIHITKIIKPVRYYATMTDDVQQVSITFKALRSDGQEVLVDDKELKSKNPLVLINYYEQHLRYNPTS